MWLLLTQHVMLPHPNLTPSPPEPPDLTPPINPSVIYVRGRVTAQVLASTADTEPKQSNSSSEACLCCSRFSVHVSRLLRPFPFLYLLAASSFNWIKSSSTNVAYHHPNSRDLLVIPPPPLLFTNPLTSVQTQATVTATEDFLASNIWASRAGGGHV